MATLQEYADEINKRIVNNPELENLEVIEWQDSSDMSIKKVKLL
jgi:hypothetical protein